MKVLEIVAVGIIAIIAKSIYDRVKENENKIFDIEVYLEDEDSELSVKQFLNTFDWHNRQS